MNEFHRNASNIFMRPEGQEMLLMIVGVVKHINGIVQQFIQMGFEEHIIVQALNAYTPTGNLNDLTTEALFNEVEFQVAKDKEDKEALALSTSPPPPNNYYLNVDRDDVAGSSSSPASATPNIAPVGSFTAGSSSASAAASAAASATLSLFRINGIDNLTMLMSRSKFKISDRVTPRALYPKFRSSMSFEERFALFQNLLLVIIIIILMKLYLKKNILVNYRSDGMTPSRQPTCRRRSPCPTATACLTRS